MRFVAMSDLHLSKKPWQVRKALNMAKDTDAVLLAGDLVNDGKPEQFEEMYRCIEEILPSTPVFSVTGNHDYPPYPSPMIRDGVGDYPALQQRLLSRQSHPYIQDASGAYAVGMGEVEIIGLNCATHWRRFKFPNGDQLKWLSAHLDASNVRWHIILCHAPLLAHNPKRSDRQPYLSRDDQLQKIIDAHRNIIFISGHTHVSMNSQVSCVEWDEPRSNIYINDGSIRPTTVLRADGRAEQTPDTGNLVLIEIDENQVQITPILLGQ